VFTYEQVLSGKAQVGQRVAVIGGGGIGVDTALYLLEPKPNDVNHFMQGWGAEPSNTVPGGLKRPKPQFTGRQVTIFQRGNAPAGRHAGPTIGWAVKATMMMAAVKIESNVEYLRVDAEGLHYAQEGAPKVQAFDTIVICAGQVENKSLFDELSARGKSAHLIGGAKQAAGLDALRAIEEGMKVAMAI
jgi:2,4-dienoyl-CoA reductase (NADPH2)